MKTIPNLSLIVAMAQNRVIGANNGLPWRLREDMAFFARTTTGHTVLMGRKTFESIGRPLPNRRNIVISRSGEIAVPGVEVVRSLNEAIAKCSGDGEVFVIGGVMLYQESLLTARRVYLTEIHRNFDGDTYFPMLPGGFHETARVGGTSAADPTLSFDFVTYEQTDQRPIGADPEREDTSER